MQIYLGNILNINKLIQKTFLKTKLEVGTLFVDCYIVDCRLMRFIFIGSYFDIVK